MTKYVLDTNFYIHAVRSPEKASELERFYAVALPFIYLSAVVVQEVLAGATNAQKRQDVERTLIRPFQSRGRVLTPSFGAWHDAGRVLGDLISRGFQQMKASFGNDVLLAVSCRESGVTLVTENLTDFERIRTVLDFEFVPPWPATRP